MKKIRVFLSLVFVWAFYWLVLALGFLLLDVVITAFLMSLVVTGITIFGWPGGNPPLKEMTAIAFITVSLMLGTLAVVSLQRIRSQRRTSPGTEQSGPRSPERPQGASQFYRR